MANSLISQFLVKHFFHEIKQLAALQSEFFFSDSILTIMIPPIHHSIIDSQFMLEKSSENDFNVYIEVKLMFAFSL